MITALFGLLVIASVPQDTVEITEVSCPECVIVLDSLVRLGSDSDPSSLRPSGPIARDSRGRYFGRAISLGHILVFDSSGRFLDMLGHPGRGPREFELIHEIEVGPGDTVHVFHGARRSFITPTFEIFDGHAVPGRVGHATIMPPYGTVVVANMTTRATAGYPLHRIVHDSVVSSFGAATPEMGMNGLVNAIRPVVGLGASVWLGRMNAYVVEEWTVDGDFRQAFRRAPAWFQEWEMAGSMYNRTKVRFLGRMDDRLLFVALSVPQRGALLAWKPLPQGEQPAPTAADVNKDFRTHLEIIDPNTGDMIVSQRMGRYLAGAVGGPTPAMVFSHNEEWTGATYVIIWAVRVLDPNR